MTPKRDSPSDTAKAIEASVAQMRRSFGREPKVPPVEEPSEHGLKVGYYVTFAILAVGITCGAYWGLKYATAPRPESPGLPVAQAPRVEPVPARPSLDRPAKVPVPVTSGSVNRTNSQMPTPVPRQPPKEMRSVQSHVRPIQTPSPAQRPVAPQPATPDLRDAHARVAFEYARDHFLNRYSVGSTSRVYLVELTLIEMEEVSGWDQYRTTGEAVLRVGRGGGGRTERVTKRFEVVTETRPGGFIRGERIFVRDSFNFER